MKKTKPKSVVIWRRVTIIFGIILGIALLSHVKNIPDDVETKQLLYQSKELAEQDFARLKTIPGASCKTTDSGFEISFEEEKYELILSYDKEGNLMSERFIGEPIKNMGLIGDVAFVAVITITFSVFASIVKALLLAIPDNKSKKHKKLYSNM